ncbi:hypothetical protein ABVK25_002620 [Lepraria finkii]|uniref:Uncharacterized protein n=1 Tax=Lepraria finkii TaxID=1340010 RepID=A0ABR4BJ83_9LECA
MLYLQSLLTNHSNSKQSPVSPGLPLSTQTSQYPSSIGALRKHPLSMASLDMSDHLVLLLITFELATVHLTLVRAWYIGRFFSKAIKHMVVCKAYGTTWIDIARFMAYFHAPRRYHWIAARSECEAASLRP